MTRLEPESESTAVPDQQAKPESTQVAEEVLSGKEKIVSHVGASQYRGGGIASCGLAGLNFVRVVLARVEQGLEGGRLLEDVLSQRTGEEVISICSRWASNVHLEVEDIFKAMPVFKRSLSLVSSTYGEPSFQRFRGSLRASIYSPLCGRADNASARDHNVLQAPYRLTGRQAGCVHHLR